MDPSCIHCRWSAALTLAMVGLEPHRSLVTSPGSGPTSWLDSLLAPWTWFITLPCLGPALPAALRLCIPPQLNLSSQLACLKGAALLLLLPVGDTSGPWLSDYSGLIAQPGSSWCFISVSLMLPGCQRRISSSNGCLMPLVSCIRKNNVIMTGRYSLSSVLRYSFPYPRSHLCFSMTSQYIWKTSFTTEVVCPLSLCNVLGMPPFTKWAFAFFKTTLSWAPSK